MTILLIALMLIILFTPTVLRILGTLLFNIEANKPVICILHKWDYDSETKDMVCSNCHKTPSQILSELRIEE